jgi:hypothetical protein
MVEAHTVLFQGGDLYLTESGPGVERTVQQISSFFGAKEGHLPSSQAMLSKGRDDWVAGPRIVHGAEAAAHANLVCREGYSEENALFLFPWGADNAFHGMNDNVFRYTYTPIHNAYGTSLPYIHTYIHTA